MDVVAEELRGVFIHIVLNQFRAISDGLIKGHGVHMPPGSSGPGIGKPTIFKRQWRSQEGTEIIPITEKAAKQEIEGCCSLLGIKILCVADATG